MRVSFRSFGLPALPIVMCGTLCIFLLHDSGTGTLTYDSFRYLRGAESILDEGRYLDLDGRPQQIWPPGTSLLYALVSRLSGAPPASLILPVSLVSYTAAALMFSLFMHRSGTRPWLATIALGAFFLNGSCLAVHNALLSDPPALCLLLAAFLLAQSIVRTTGLVPVLVGTAVAAMAILFRYAMLPLVPLMVISVAMSDRRHWQALVPLAAVLPTPLILALLGASRGNRATAIQSIPWVSNAQAAASLADQILPVRFAGPLLATFAISAVCVAAGAVLLRARFQSENHRGEVGLLPVVWLGLYLPFLVATQGLAKPSFVLDQRILLPALLGVVVLLATAGEAKWSGQRLLALLLIVPLVVMFARSARFAITQLVREPDVTSANCVTREEVIATVREIKAPGPYLSNAQGVVWYALRQDVLTLTRATAVETPKPATVIWVHPARACGNVIMASDYAPPRDITMDTPVQVFGLR